MYHCLSISISFTYRLLWVLIETTCPGNTIPSCAMFVVHLTRRLKLTIVITRCPSSVVRLSLTFLHFRVLLLNHWTEFNEPWQDAGSQRPLTFVIFGRIRKKDVCSGLCLAEIFSTSNLKPLNGIQRKRKQDLKVLMCTLFGPLASCLIESLMIWIMQSIVW